jgi:hypothetical protein
VCPHRVPDIGTTFPYDQRSYQSAGVFTYEFARPRLPAPLTVRTLFECIVSVPASYQTELSYGYENPAGGVTTDTTRVNYLDRVELWLGYEPFVLDLAQTEGVQDIAELGGGANPFVAGEKWDFAQHRVVIDISPRRTRQGA